MHKKFKAADFAAISVSVDKPDDAGAQQQVLAFLKGQEATFTNLVLNDKKWEEKLRIGSLPCVFVFDRRGQFYQFGSTGEVIHADVLKRVEELVRDEGRGARGERQK